MINTIVECDRCQTKGASIREHNFMAPLESKRLLSDKGWAFRKFEHLCDACVRAERAAELEQYNTGATK